MHNYALPKQAPALYNENIYPDGLASSGSSSIYMSRITLTNLVAAAGITLIAGVLFLVSPFADTGRALLSTLATIGQPGVAAELTGSAAATAASHLTKTYTDQVYGFSFDHPEGMLVQTLPDPDGYLVLAAIPNTKHELQIFVTPFRTDIELTKNIIRAEIPQTILGDIEHVTVGDSISAFRFLADDPSLGQTLEIIFTDQLGNLYQLTTYPEAREWLEGILKTWRIDPHILFPS